jgi:hypothetical protein
MLLLIAAFGLALTLVLVTGWTVVRSLGDGILLRAVGAVLSGF